MSSKAKGDSITQKLLDLQRKTGVAYQNIVTAFLIERLVVRLISEKRLKDSLVFKGGFVGLKVYQSPRFTIDLDALLTKSNIDKTLELTKNAAETDLQDGVWFRFEEQVDLQTQGEYGGIRQVFRAGVGEVLKNVKKAKIINFDLGIGDPVTPGPRLTDTQLMISNESISWSVYPIETIIAEKLHALIERGEENSRSKDIHDLSIFLPRADKKILRAAIKNCFTYRETKVPESLSDFLKILNTSVLERGWVKAMASINNAPQFEVSFKELIAQLEKFESE